MTSKTIAVYRGGVFTPEGVVDVPENQRVMLEIAGLPEAGDDSPGLAAESSDAWIARWRAMVDSMPDVHGPVADDRESIYAGREQ
ncbi:MAG TPA: antitoxin family protein [Planctomycetia bacterium]|nr:antitoxin family protein [Planctomycetia bacterium]